MPATDKSACMSAADCAEVSTGCCLGHIVDSVAEDSVWGDMEAIMAGEQENMCISAEFQAEVEAVEFPTNALVMMNAWINTATEEELAEAGLFPGDDATFMAESQGSDGYTLENVVISSASCQEAAEEAATALVAASASLLAVALLN